MSRQAIIICLMLTSLFGALCLATENPKPQVSKVLSVDEFEAIAKNADWSGLRFPETDQEAAPILYNDLLLEKPNSDAEHQKTQILLTYSWGQRYVCAHPFPLLDKLRDRGAFFDVLSRFGLGECSDCVLNNEKVIQWEIAEADPTKKETWPRTHLALLVDIFGSFSCSHSPLLWSALLHLAEAGSHDASYMGHFVQQAKYYIWEKGMPLQPEQKQQLVALCDRLLKEKDKDLAREQIEELRKFLITPLPPYPPPGKATL